MGKKKKKAQEDKPWCWYCDREFDDEKILIQHQKAKHFKCHICHRKLNTASGMVIHAMQVHKERLTQVYNAKPGRESVDIEIFGMEGIPEDDIKAKAVERGMAEPDLKKAKVDSPAANQSFLVAPAPPGFVPAVPAMSGMTSGASGAPGIPGMPGFPPGFPQPPPGMPPPGFPPPGFPMAPPGMPPPGFMQHMGMFPGANGAGHLPPMPGFPGFPPPGMAPPHCIPAPPTQASMMQGATTSAAPAVSVPSPAPAPPPPQAAFPAYSQPQTTQQQTPTHNTPPLTAASTNSNTAPPPPAPAAPTVNFRQQNADGSTLVFNHPSKSIEEVRAEFPQYRYIRA